MASSETKTGVTLLGATGSIGLSTLDVLARHPERYRLMAVTANTDVEGMLRICDRHQPEWAVMADTAAAERLEAGLRRGGSETRVLAGNDGLVQVATLAEVDYVMAAIVGAAGLPPALSAAGAGKTVLLANKEALVMSGALFMDQVRGHHATLLPIDSEHNAVFQCMPDGYIAGQSPQGVRRILLTASGGPFRTRSLDELADVTPAEAVAHPNWDMGRKISVDSATMMNKGLEVIEACWLFAIDVDRVEVVLHPQSVIHSLVDYDDGSVLAQLGNPDMRTPIAHALAWPRRIASGVAPLDLVGVGRLEFEAPDLVRFPCLRLAYEAIRAGGTAPAILNAANEVAVAAFLDERLAFTAIPEVIEAVLGRLTPQPADSLEAVLAADAGAREAARELCARGRRQAVS
ncbi:1-deoxy-D-xylulose-5-phosphate reductoisomerase [Thiohalobacter thiocyanaticus]|uniref:1-deoxy-D-xylulose 5-phosphate reductoisomerase n=1 Tax=Thiohalobacter thiocyanaticus TaxID=585455 RepID=A0A426QE62_9GAMM|nr:1-deoxy-D-xylulose-5-phosphate reductoisomerase [Thiohalobacter thiocyanaticus]RRQ20050.1 1-deoxy-D-xylulose-5-phosphate reductoisomerase [Thiohalobacter thiocyanaticus]